jgi:hypothetical protein
LHDDAAFVIDSVQGVVRQIDPRTLSPIGDALRYPPGITGGVFDGAGRLWIAEPSEGTVSGISLRSPGLRLTHHQRHGRRSGRPDAGPHRHRGTTQPRPGHLHAGQRRWPC